MDKILESIVNEFKKLDEVEAVLLAGSKTSKITDEMSDYDIYIYQNKAISIDKKTEIAKKFADILEINNNFWENGDEWLLRGTNTGVDIMYRSFDWIEEQLNRVVFENQASVGYSTCFWANYITSEILYDKNNKAKFLQEKYNVEYSNELQKNILEKNYPILKDNISSYYNQIKKALKREDLVSVNHRIAALLASYFDIIFAVNKILHPGEKKLIKIMKENVKDKPENAENDILLILKNCNSDEVLKNIESLINNLNIWLKPKFGK